MASDLRLPKHISFSNVHHEGWDPVVARASSLSEKVINGPVSYRDSEDARALAYSADFDKLLVTGLSRRQKRGLFGLWAGDGKVARETLNLERLKTILSRDSDLGRLTVLALTRLYFNHFDLLDEWSPGASAFIQTQISMQLKRNPKAQSKAKNLTTFFSENPKWRTALDGPSLVSRSLTSAETRLDDFLTEHHIQDLSSSRYVQIIRQHVYLDRIRQADHCAHHKFLSDFTGAGATSTLESRSSDGRYFGHLIIEAMADKPEMKPHASWINTIFEIAGDPRMAFSPKWQQWWQPVNEKSRRRVISWLSGDELKLFLAAVKEATQYDFEQARMFPARKRFLEGLYNLGLIKETRLFAGNIIRADLKERLGNNLLASITTVQSAPRLAVISIDCGDFHIVEGSSSFKIHVFTAGSPEKLKDWAKIRFTRSDFATNIPVIYGSEFGWDSVESIVHHRQTWQFNTLQFLGDHGIAIDAESVMDKSDYERMISRSDQGLPRVRRTKRRRG